MDNHTAEIACKVKFYLEIKRLEELFRIKLANLTLDVSARKSQTLGNADVVKGIVWINASYFDTDENIDHIMNQTITHEICHIVECKKYGTSGHGPQWKHLMRVAGKAPDRCAPVIVPETIKKSQRVVKRVIIGCAYCNKEFTLTQTLLTRIMNKTTNKAYCNKCHNHLSTAKILVV